MSTMDFGIRGPRHVPGESSRERRRPLRRAFDIGPRGHAARAKRTHCCPRLPVQTPLPNASGSPTSRRCEARARWWRRRSCVRRASAATPDTRNAWVLMARADDSFAAWADYFADRSATRTAIEAGMARAVDADRVRRVLRRGRADSCTTSRTMSAATSAASDHGATSSNRLCAVSFCPRPARHLRGSSGNSDTELVVPGEMYSYYQHRRPSKSAPRRIHPEFGGHRLVPGEVPCHSPSTSSACSIRSRARSMLRTPSSPRPSAGSGWGWRRIDAGYRPACCSSWD